MGLFFGKAKMDEGERKSRAEAIQKLLNAGQITEAYKQTLELEKLDKDAAGYFMADFYFEGQQVKEDEKEALKRIDRYVRRVPDDADGWLRYGLYLMSGLKFEEAASCLEKAVKLGQMEGVSYLAGCYKGMADQHRNQAAGTLDTKSYAQNNSRAIALYIRAMAQYDRAAKEHTSWLSDADWQSYGRAADMMYFLSLNGEVKKIKPDDSASADYISMGLSVIKGKADTTEQIYWRMNAIRVYSQMEQAGYQVLAEYFRASMCLYDCSEKKNQSMFTNARWHMDRAEELYANLSAEQKKEYPEDFSDVFALYNKMNKKYGKVLENRLRAGEYPVLGQDYEGGQAPAMEECKRFMAFVDSLGSVQTASAQPAEVPGKKKKGLFGLFR